MLFSLYSERNELNNCTPEKQVLQSTAKKQAFFFRLFGESPCLNICTL